MSGQSLLSVENGMSLCLFKVMESSHCKLLSFMSSVSAWRVDSIVPIMLRSKLSCYTAVRGGDRVGTVSCSSVCEVPSTTFVLGLWQRPESVQHVSMI